MSDILQHKHIVFGFEHYNPLGIVRSLGEYGIKPICIIVRNERAITSKSKYVGQLHLVDTIEEGYEYLRKQYGNCERKPFVYTSDDQITNLLDSQYGEIKDRFFFFNAGKTGRIAEHQNKFNILQAASRHGIQYLKTYVVNRGEIPQDIEYPIITKAIISTLDDWKKDMIICNNEHELKEAYKIIRSEKILLQKYIVKKNELCMEGFSVNKGKNTVITIASSYNYQLENSYSPYMTVSNLKNFDLEEKLKLLIEDIGFEGIFEIEFLVDENDELFFLEINFRNSTWSYASTVAGMNLPISWAKGMLEPTSTETVFCTIAQPFTAMVEFDDYKNRVKSKKVTLIQWIRDFCNSKCKYYCASGDYIPVVNIVLNKVLRLAGKKGRK